jgi:hypothetical protein
MPSLQSRTPAFGALPGNGTAIDNLNPVQHLHFGHLPPHHVPVLPVERLHFGHLPPHHVLVFPVQHHALAGLGDGSYWTMPRVWMPPKGEGMQPDLCVLLGRDYRLQGVADLAGLGRVTVSGSVHEQDFGPRQGHAEGTLTFTNAHGSVTVKLEGSMHGPFDNAPQLFSYHVVSGTGAYQHMADHGTLQLTLAPPSLGPGPGLYGTFTLTI